jgi:hypothetical protein
MESPGRPRWIGAAYKVELWSYVVGPVPSPGVFGIEQRLEEIGTVSPWRSAMRHFRSARRFLVVIIGLWLLFSAAVQYGQGCAMCYTSMANSTQAKRAEKTLNAAILILLLPAATIFIGIFLVAYRYRNAFNSDAGSETLSLSLESYPLMAPPNDLLRSDREASLIADTAACKRVA